MPDQFNFNPYQAPQADIHPRAAQWLAAPSESLSRVATGLGLVYAANIAWFILLLIFIFGPYVSMPMVLVIAPFATYLFLAVGAVNVVGTLMCLAVPGESGAKGFITTTAMISIFGIIVRLMIIPLPENARLIVAASVLLAIVSTIFFLLFLQKLAEFIGSFSLASRARTVLMGSLVIVTLVVGTFLGVMAISAGIRLLFIPILMGSLIVFVMYVNLLDALRKAILGRSY